MEGYVYFIHKYYVILHKRLKQLWFLVSMEWVLKSISPWTPRDDSLNIKHIYIYLLI
jgi:hypothetical protein